MTARASDFRDNALQVGKLDYCRGLRRGATDAEEVLWERLRSRQVAGAKFRRQHQFGPFILDFYCPERRLVVEADGGQHFSSDVAAADAARSAFLEARGLTVLRFTNVQILQETDLVVEMIWRVVERPHPDPLPEGEGIL